MIYKGFPLVSVKLIQNIRSKIQVSTFVYIKSCCIEVIYVRFASFIVNGLQTKTAVTALEK